MTERYDLVVIGTGVAATAVVDACAEKDWRIAVVDSRPYGGTCPLRGCDPKKVLVGAAGAVERARLLHGKGVSGDVGIDWGALMRFKRTFTTSVPADREEHYRKRGVETLHGRARFTGPTTVRVGDAEAEARRVVVASGSKPAPFPVEGADLLTTSADFLELDALPERIVFLGGGYISFEFAHVAARAGAHVTILEREERPLEEFDPDLVDRLVARTRELGVDVRVRAEVESVRALDGGGLEVRASGEAFRGEVAVHGGGRVPEIDDLSLEAAGVAREKRGVKVKSHLQSVSNPAVYAAGDAAATEGAPLTPVAALEGKVVARNLIDGGTREPDYRGIPSVAFTLPPLARVGLLEREARERGLRFRVEHEDTTEWFHSSHIGGEASAYKVLVEEETDRVLGAHLLGHDADEVVNLYALAIRGGLTARDVKDVPYAFPTGSYEVRYHT